MFKFIYIAIVSVPLTVAAICAPNETDSSEFVTTSENPTQVEDQKDEAEDEFEKTIWPLVETYCADCHAGFLEPETTADVFEHRNTYTGILERMDNRSMPPKNYDEQPTDEERKLVADWITKTLEIEPGYFDRIAPYVVETYEDKDGNLWLGTMSKGAARYDGKSLTWFTMEDGLSNNAVPSFAEDKDGNLWVGTQEGVCRFDGDSFIQYGSDEGLPGGYGRVRADRDGNIWAGMNTGVFRLDGNSFTEFEVPIDKSKIASYSVISGQVSMAMEDTQGNLWFKTDGYGAFMYDGTSFTRFTKDDGLGSNNVTNILEDQQGNIWFACVQSSQPRMTGDGGLSRYDGKSFTSFPEVKGLSDNDIYTIYETKAGDIWIGATRVGAYRYDGTTFTLFDKTDRPHWTRNFGLQGMHEDQNGNLWFGFSGGLFRFDGKSFLNVPRLGAKNESDAESRSNAGGR